MSQVQDGISIIMPCLNEEKTVGSCIRKAYGYLDKVSALNGGAFNGEVIVVDNGSTDNSVEIAKSLNARVVHIKNKGYGSALRGGIEAAKYRYIVIGDADESYNFSDLDQFIEKLDEGYDLVMGNRFKGGIEKGAMPWSHRCIGNPVLSWVGRLFYKTKIGDFHCGLRAFRKDRIKKLNLSTTGMEFASEMVVKAVLFGLNITEVPCKLYPDGRDRPPHLRSIPDGLRHLLFLFIYSPRWLFLYPGIFLTLLSAVLLMILYVKPIYIFSLRLEIITMFYASVALTLGLQAVTFSLFTYIYGKRIGQLPDNSSIVRKLEEFMSTNGFIAASLCIAIGLFGMIVTLIFWSNRGFGEIEDTVVHRTAILFGTFFIIGFHMLLSCFFVNVLHMGDGE